MSPLVTTQDQTEAMVLRNAAIVIRRRAKATRRGKVPFRIQVIGRALEHYADVINPRPT